MKFEIFYALSILTLEQTKQVMKKSLYSVLRNAELGDCTGHGLSSRVTRTKLFWDCTKEEAIDWCMKNHEAPDLQMYLVKRDLWGEDHSYAEPLVKPDNANQMFGGNFLYTSNGNSYHFDGEKCTRPIPIHDRFERWQ